MPRYIVYPLCALVGYCTPFLFGYTFNAAYDVPVLALIGCAVPVLWYAGRHDQ